MCVCVCTYLQTQLITMYIFVVGKPETMVTGLSWWYRVPDRDSQDVFGYKNETREEANVQGRDLTRDKSITA